MDENNTQQPGGFPDPSGNVNPQQPDTTGYTNPPQSDMTGYANPQQPDMTGYYGQQPGQPDMTGYYGQQPMQPQTGGKKPKKPMTKGKLGALIGAGVAIVALVVCGVIFLPKLLSRTRKSY